MFKRFLVYILGLLLLGSTAFAASATITSDEAAGERTTRAIVVRCIGNIADLTLSTSTGLTGPLTGWTLYDIKAKNDSSWASITDNSDVYLRDSDGFSLSGTTGENMLDDDTVNVVAITTYYSIIGDPVLDVDNQAESAGVFDITLMFKY